MTQPGVEQWLTTATRQRIRDFTRQLRGVSDTSAAVPNLDWTVADLGQHVASLDSHFRLLQEDAADFVWPDNFATFSTQRRAHITETDAAQLADRIDTELDNYLAVLAESDTRWIYGMEASTTTMTAMLLSEAVLHGRDLAAVTGAKPPMFDTAEAHAVADATMITTSLFVDPAKAKAQPDGVYHIKFRGGKDYTWTKAGGELLVSEGKPAKADAHLNTDAGVFMLSSLGRISQAKAALSGKMVTYGRKPWRFLGLGNVVLDGI